MLNSLRLDDATRAKVKPILDDELKKLLDVTADKTLSFEESVAKDNSIKADTDAQMNSSSPMTSMRNGKNYCNRGCPTILFQ